MIDVEKLTATTFIRHVDWFEETSSTNDLALNLSGEDCSPIPRLIGATTQIAGRGRGTNQWWGGQGTLMFSVLLDMTEFRLPQNQWPQFSLLTGLSVAETLEVFLPMASIGLKWPNDVWIGFRKVCGILIEQSDQADGRIVVGVGWNVNTSFATAPNDVQNVATSMRDEVGSTFSFDDVLICFLQRWEANIKSLAGNKIDLVNLWSRFCVLKGRRIRIQTGETSSTADCLGISCDGALLTNHQGEFRRLYAGTIRLIE